jgi:hypothetical protein
MNTNRITVHGFSNRVTEELYDRGWPGEPELKQKADQGDQCGACSFFASLDDDYGVCCHPKSRHHLERVFEHFTCPTYEQEGWGPHSFTTVKDRHCRCNGEGSEYWDSLLAAIAKHERGGPAADSRKEDPDFKSEI